MKKQTETGLILLAAGSSGRMGTPKQLLEFEGETFLSRAVQTALASNCRPVAVVLGANPEILSDELAGTKAEIVQNPNWTEGMSSSIRAGLSRLLEINEGLRAVVIMVCDQPLVSAELINRLIEKHAESGALIVASEYARTRGVPALFDRRLFPELLTLKAGRGAKNLIRRYSAETVAVPFPGGEFDIDTPEDYRRLVGGSLESLGSLGSSESSGSLGSSGSSESSETPDSPNSPNSLNSLNSKSG